MLIMNKKYIKKSGFTLIEIIVVLFIITMALLGILSLITQSIRAQDYNKKVIIANQLSQEGIELIRRVRDNNWKNSNPFNLNLATNLNEEKTYIMDFKDSIPSETSDYSLQINDDGFFVHESLFENSGFSRMIEVELINEDILRIQSTVYWKSFGGDQEYTTEALLYDWY